MIDLYIKH